CRVKRALKLDTIKKDNVTTPLKTKKKNLNSYSPTTGTCQMSPFSSPTSHNIVFNLLCRFMELQSKVKNSLAKILKIRENLKSLQALEGSRELENIIGVSDLSCILSAEMQKTQVLTPWVTPHLNSHCFLCSLSLSGHFINSPIFAWKLAHNANQCTIRVAG
uniref:Integrin subunit beta 3 binding protein n=1 Tax=Nothoprocta perdicaria TaxID=30464 RepID=A0A8C6YMB7_NOTPE